MNKRGSHVNCCVYGCHNMKGRDKHLSFHSFPKENAGDVYITNEFGVQEKVDRRKAWEIKLLMGKRTTTFMRVCSLHFNRDDFILPDIECKCPRLKKTAVPSQNLPRESYKQTGPKLRGRLKFPQKMKNKKITNLLNRKKKVYDLLEEKEKIAIEGLLQLVATNTL